MPSIATALRSTPPPTKPSEAFKFKAAQGI
jgi:hypothetical protein